MTVTLVTSSGTVAAWQRPRHPAIEIPVGRAHRCGSPTPTGCTSPTPAPTKLDLVDYYLSVGPGIVNALRERPCMLHRFPDRGQRREGAPEAGAARRPAVAGDRAPALPPLRAARRRAVRHRAGRGDLGGADVDRRVPSVELAAGRHREARRVADRPRPDARLPVRHGPPGRPRRPRGARRARRRRLAEDVGRQGDARLRPHRAATTGSPTCAGPRWPSPARSSGARPTT